MSETFIADLTNQALASVDVRIVLLLMAIGCGIKHLKVLEKIQNDLIPVVLFAISFVVNFIICGISLESAVTASVTAAVSIGIHQSGKNIFMVNVPKVVELAKSYLGGSLIPKLLEKLMPKAKAEVEEEKTEE